MKKYLMRSAPLVLLLVVSTIAIGAIQVECMPFNSGGTDRMPWLCGDTMYYVSGNYDIYQVTAVDGVWGTPEPVKGAINTAANEINPCVIENNGQLIMYFARYTGTETDYDFFRSEFDTATGEWEEAKKQNALSTPKQDWDIWVNSDETLVYLTTNGAYGSESSVGGRDIWRSKRKDSGKNWYMPTNVKDINTSGSEWSVFVDPNDLVWFDAAREDAMGGYDIYTYNPTTREISHPSMQLNSFYDDRSMWTDGEIMFFTTKDRKDGKGSYDIYFANFE